MTQAPKQLLVAACIAVLALSAGAQTPPAPGFSTGPGPGGGPGPMAMRPGHPGMMQEQHRAHMQQRRAQREARLKQILQITPAQDSAWNAWTAARRPADMQRPNPGELAQLPTPERIDRMRALRTARSAEMDRRSDATKVFYAALNPSQQKAFDALTARRWDRGMGGRHGGWGHHRG